MPRISDGSARRGVRTLLALLVLLALAPAAAAAMGDHPLRGGESLTLRFDAAGQVRYLCIPHPSMRATLEVVEGGPANATVRLKDLRFDPVAATVGVGGNITFVNEDEVFHTVTAEAQEGGNAMPVPALAAGAALLAARLLRRR